jgi:hypothetical protein
LIFFPSSCRTSAVWSTPGSSTHLRLWCSKTACWKKILYYNSLLLYTKVWWKEWITTHEIWTLQSSVAEDSSLVECDTVKTLTAASCSEETQCLHPQVKKSEIKLTGLPIRANHYPEPNERNPHPHTLYL